MFFSLDQSADRSFTTATTSIVPLTFQYFSHNWIALTTLSSPTRNIDLQMWLVLFGLTRHAVAHNVWLYGVAGLGALINAAQRNV